VLGYSTQACSLKAYKYCELGLGRKCVLSEKHVSGQHNSELPAFKRKYRSKGIQVFLPHIQNAEFTQFTLPDEYICLLLSTQSTYKVEYVQGKRGPPSFLS